MNMIHTMAVGFIVITIIAWFRYYRLRDSFEDIIMAFIGAMAFIVLFALIGDIVGQTL